MRRTLLWCLATLVAAGTGLFVLGGFYDISATRQHPFLVYRGLVLVRDTLVGLWSTEVSVPQDFSPQADARGAGLYDAHCAACHGAPGKAPADFALGMMPVPPPLVSVAGKAGPAEIFWLVKYGLKMSGMPAWELRLSEPDMWRVTAFVEALPTLSPADYESLLSDAGGGVAAVAQVEADASGDDAERGRLAMQVYACRSCHIVPGMVGADVHVGPDLSAAGARRFIAGVIPNTPDNMVRWITQTHAVDPLSAMPDLGVPENVAVDIAAYLYQHAPKPPAPPGNGDEAGSEVASRDDRD